jgi:hypothetical protein
VPQVSPSTVSKANLSPWATGLVQVASKLMQLALELAALPMVWLLKEATSSVQPAVPSQQTSSEALNSEHHLRPHSQVSSNSVQSPNSVVSEVQAPSLAVGQAGLLPMTPMLTLLWI